MSWVPLVAGAALLLAAAGLAHGARRWAQVTRELRSALDAQRTPSLGRFVGPHELPDLPSPVAGHLRRVLREGQPRIEGVRVRHSGTFDLGQGAPRWRRFTSEQRVVLRPPASDWNARIALAPGLAVRVHDAYLGGEGLLLASLGGLVTLADLRGGGDLAQGELMRFLAEAAWYPTALLPSHGVRWEAIDDRSARATLTDHGVEATLLFSFGADGLLERVSAEARARTVGRGSVPTPWQGRFWDYQERSGVLLPLEAEVVWLLPEGPRPYWRGRIDEIEYELTG